MSKVATQQRTTTGQRAVPYPTANSRNVPVASTSNARRAPPRADYRVDRIIHKGVPTEVLTIEDTPPLAGGPSGAGRQTDSYASSSRYDSAYSANYEPAAKKRKNDGAHISDQPYASTSAYRHNPPNQHGYQNNYTNGSGVNGVGSQKNKRKLDAQDSYGQDRLPQKKEYADKDGHFIVRIGDKISVSGSGDWEIKKLLGQGTFGKVVQAQRLESGDVMAIKIIRNVPKYREASKVEINVLKKLKLEDPHNKYNCIHLKDEFDYQGHVCLSFELLSSSVFDFLKENQYHPFPFSQIQHFARQLLESVSFIHRLNYIHTDLKPENILLVNSDYRVVPNKKSKTRRILKDSRIRLIDFGSATGEKDYHATVVSTRHYRAPEIILGTGWSKPCDIWSIGCILIEFFTGEALFQTHENVEHLAMMKRVFGEMPDAFILKAVKQGSHAEWFRRVDQKDKIDRSRNPSMTQILDFPVATTANQSKKFVRQMRPLKDIVPANDITSTRFLDLLQGLLAWEPEKRTKVDDALRHPFFSIKIDDDASSLNGSVRR